MDAVDGAPLPALEAGTCDRAPTPPLPAMSRGVRQGGAWADNVTATFCPCMVRCTRFVIVMWNRTDCAIDLQIGVCRTAHRMQLAGSMLIGIDCADVDENKHPDWGTARSHGSITFAIIRASWGAAPDKVFAQNWPALKAAGLTRGAYMFLRFPRKGSPAPAPPQQQARKFLEIVGPLDRSDLPGAIDVEFPGGRSATGLTAQEALGWVRAARDVVAEQGAPPIIYTSARVWKEDLDNLDAPDLVESPLWLARYVCNERLPAILGAALVADHRFDPEVPRPWGDPDFYWLHQRQGDALGMPGMSNTVDVNRFNLLVEGARGKRVAWVQRRLGIAASGQFDDAMQRAVIAYQRDHGLVPDGVIGPRTFARLCWERTT